MHKKKEEKKCVVWISCLFMATPLFTSIGDGAVPVTRRE